MIQGLMDSGRRSLYDYTGGRSDQPGYEFPGAIGNEDSGIGRLAKQWFSSDDQLVTLGAQFPQAALWPLARHYGAPMVVHGGVADLVNNPDMAGPDQCFIHATGFSDAVWQVAADKGCHISIAGAIEMQMGHGTPPYQLALDRDILPSLSADVDTNMTPNMFTLMRTAFCLQRLLVNPSQIAEPKKLKASKAVPLFPKLSATGPCVRKGRMCWWEPLNPSSRALPLAACQALARSS
jgi:hypothetical protein